MGWTELLAVAGTTLGVTWTFVQGAIKHVTEVADACRALAQQPERCVCAVCKVCSICDQSSAAEPSLLDLYWPYLFILCLAAGTLIGYKVGARSVGYPTHFEDNYCEWEPPQPAAEAAVSVGPTKSGRKGKRPPTASVSTDVVDPRWL